MSSLSTPQTEPSQNINDRALLHMQEKYGEEFTYLSPWGNRMTGNREFLASCNSLPGQPVLVRIENYKSDTPVFGDNYWTEYFKQETIDYFQEVANEVFSESIIHYQTNKSNVTDALGVGTVFEDYYCDPSTQIVVYIEVKASVYTSEDQFSQFFAKLRGSQGKIMVSVIVVDDSVYGTLDHSEISTLTYQEKDIASAYAKAHGGDFQSDTSKED